MSILIVDDSRTQLFLLTTLLNQGGYQDILGANSAQEAFDCLGLDRPDQETCAIDLILLDVDMPDMDGVQACQRIKASLNLRDIPIIMITASSGFETLYQAFEAGAMDYITKPPHPVEMLARVRSALRLKQEIDRRKAREESLAIVNQHLEHTLTLLQNEQEKSDQLLLNILPPPVAVRLKAGEAVIADHFSDTSVMFTDVVGFTAYASRVSPSELIEHLNRLFKRIDLLVKRHGLEKIKTSGDAYLVAGGVPTPRPDHLEAMAELALDIQAAQGPGEEFQMRSGIHIGPVVGGVIGEDRFIYDIWGDTVNVASRMQSHCPPGQTLVTGQVYQCLHSRYTFETLGKADIKGKGEMDLYLLTGRKP